MSIASALTVAPSSSEPNESPLGQLRAAHEALVQFAERWFVDSSQRGEYGPAASAADGQLAELSIQYANLERQLDAARAEAAQRPAAREELAAIRAALADSRLQNESLRNQLALAREAEEQLHTTLSELQSEHRGLMAELHVLRYRTTGLAEELSREKQHALAERSLWNNELAHWRHMLEAQFGRLAGGQRTLPDGRAFATLVPGLPADAMLQSILTDFQMIEHHPSPDS
jgi:DNA repair exonuclease SbcCD ATPase subunit